MPEQSSHVVEVSDATFEDEVLKSDMPVVVDCWAIWCGPCRVLSPIIDELGGDYAGKIKVCKLDADKNPKTTETYGIMSIPTVLYFKGGKEVDRTVGAFPKPKLVPHFEALLDKKESTEE